MPRPELRELPGRGKGPPDPGTPTAPRAVQALAPPPAGRTRRGTTASFRKLGTETRPGAGPPTRSGEEAAPAGRAPGRLGPMWTGGRGDWSGRSAGPPTARSRVSSGLAAEPRAPSAVQPRRRRVRGGRPRPLLRPAGPCSSSPRVWAPGERRSGGHSLEPGFAEDRGGGRGDRCCPSRAGSAGHPVTPSQPQLSEAAGESEQRPFRRGPHVRSKGAGSHSLACSVAKKREAGSTAPTRVRTAVGHR